MTHTLTAVFRRVPEGYIGFVEEVPGANTQAATIEEARANLHEAVTMLIAENRESIEEAVKGGNVVRETLAFDFDSATKDESLSPRRAA